MMVISTGARAAEMHQSKAGQVVNDAFSFVVAKKGPGSPLGDLVLPRASHVSIVIVDPDKTLSIFIDLHIYIIYTCAHVCGYVYSVNAHTPASTASCVKTSIWHRSQKGSGRSAKPPPKQ